MKVCRRYMVTGRVQNVGFRFATGAQAQRFGITGWVRNLPTGAVEVLACGDTDALETFEQWLWEGPKAAAVSDVRADEASVQDFDDFSVRS